jgi:wee1-like protein kinase
MVIAVAVWRHRLDGIVYAVKITKKVLRPNSRDERVAMNEVFAHAAMMKHRHIVRYFNSWVESGHLHIQNEFCEGGSLDRQIEECRERGDRFAEAELKKVLVQVGRGLQYLHGKRLVHLDIKPGNILITFGEEDASIAPLPVSPDSGAASGDGATALAPSQYHATGDTVKYKIGDLGHVVKVQEGVGAAEEGDCRYMAPEFLSMDPVPGPQLLKADSVATGLTVDEAARLERLPKNSEEGADYKELTAGRLAQIDLYSRELQALLRSMVNPVPSLRPTADKLLANHLLNPSAFKSKTQLRKELKQTTEKVG